MHIDKVVRTKDEALKSVREGVKKLSKAVSPTLGPYGLMGFTEKGLKITNDGINIANEIQLEDEIEDMALRRARQAAQKANEKAGDASTTTIMQIHQTLESMVAQGKDKPTIDLLRQLAKEKDTVIEKLYEMATPIETVEQLIDSATVSTEDRELGKLLGEAQFKLGKEGVLVPEESTESGIEIELVSGVLIDNGLSDLQAMNKPEKEALEIFDVPTLLTTHTIDSIQVLGDLVEMAQKKGHKQLAVIAKAWSEIAIRQSNELQRTGFVIIPINAPYINQREVMKDLRAVLGGTFFDFEGASLDNLMYTDLGFAKRIFAQRWKAIFAGVVDEKSKERTEARVSELKLALEGSGSDFERKAITRRIAQLTNGFGLVKVGGISESERKRVFDKVEDACNAIRAAYQEGTVPGAGLAFKEIAEKYDLPLLKQPLLSINEQIMSTAPSDFVVEDWVRDPVFVLRTALEHATETAGNLATVHIAVHTKWDRHDNCKGAE